jgi:hypothetical protein
MGTTSLKNNLNDQVEKMPFFYYVKKTDLYVQQVFSHS